jgi:hypothetical protein
VFKLPEDADPGGARAMTEVFQTADARGLTLNSESSAPLRPLHSISPATNQNQHNKVAP